MFRSNGLRYLIPEEVDVMKCPYFDSGTFDTDCGKEPILGCWNPKLKTMNIDSRPESYQKCGVYFQMKKKDGNEFVLGKHTTIGRRPMTEQMVKNGLPSAGIGPVEYMLLADMSGGVEGTHILEYMGKIFTAIIRGSREVDGTRFGVVGTVRRGRPSRNTTQPVIDHREFAPPYPYASVMN